MKLIAHILRKVEFKAQQLWIRVIYLDEFIVEITETLWCLVAYGKKYISFPLQVGLGL